VEQNKILSIQYYGESSLGLVRTENQDSFGKFPIDSNDISHPKGLLFIVADGMGGHISGREASQAALKIVSREYFLFSSNIICNCLRYSFKNANIKIYGSSKEEMQFRKKGTTCTALVLENNLAHIAHVGDSRIYRITDDEIEQLTNDHTHVQEMLNKGIISKEEAKNHPSRSVLVRALGVESDIEVDVKENIPLESGQIFVLCSDGLSRVTKDEIKKIVSINQPVDACKKLIQVANDRGGQDNITVQIIKINGDNNKLKSIHTPDNTNFAHRWLIYGLISITILVIILAVIFL
jgi:protein phosphatase